MAGYGAWCTPLYHMRTDVFIKSEIVSNEERLAKVVKRRKMYCEAGPNCFCPLGVIKEEGLEMLTSAIHAPINILALPGIPPQPRLKNIGIRRLSFGPGLLRFVMALRKELLQKIQLPEGLDAVTTNAITTAYL